MLQLQGGQRIIPAYRLLKRSEPRERTRRLMSAIELAERGMLPDWLVRYGIRRLLAQRSRQLKIANLEEQQAATAEFVQELKMSPLAVSVDAANEQHYEVPAEFFKIVLGPRLKYSCCVFAERSSSLEQAEEEALRLTCQRAKIEDGMDVLELGCGWGSLTIWMAVSFPNSRIVAVSNSHRQREYIQARCEKLGLANVEVITSDICDFETDRIFDRVVSVEMFEHLRNYQELLRRISSWLRPDGKLFVHTFCHRSMPYLFQTEGANDWLGRHFFTGGMMPSHNLLLHFQEHVSLDEQWSISGLQYARTCEAWLNNLDRNREEVQALFESDTDRNAAKIMVQRWRIFFLACAELFRYRHGEEWFVGHYLLQNRPQDQLAASSGRPAQVSS